MREQGLPGAAFPDRQRADVVPRSPGRDGVKLIQARGADNVQDEVELVTVVPSGEEGSPRQEFREDAAYCPDVDCLWGASGEWGVEMRRV